MTWCFEPMTAAHAAAIAAWRYPGVYGFYDLDRDPEDLAEFMDPGSWEDVYFAVLGHDGALAGFFSFSGDAGVVELGLGLRPDLVGKGLGASFVSAGLQYARQAYRVEAFRLCVAAFNRRAIAVYKRLGFETTRSFRQQTNGGSHPFIEMQRAA